MRLLILYIFLMAFSKCSKHNNSIQKMPETVTICQVNKDTVRFIKRQTVVTLDSTSSSYLCVSSDINPSRHNYDIEHQILRFYHKGKSSVIDVSKLNLLKSHRGLVGWYRLFDAGVNSINNIRVYVLYFSVANGEPEYYLYYNRKGQLLFSCKYTKEKETITIYRNAISRKKVKMYLKKDSKINFVDVLKDTGSIDKCK